ncbi:hypothetical protein [Georgenia sp. MJ170]|uniref:hypothetical protein n=1 Tax=Georgenia sunbinii TaxID=3117728 RepID=UPI002F26D883
MTLLRRTLSLVAVAVPLVVAAPAAAVGASVGPPAAVAISAPRAVEPAAADRITWGIVPADAEGGDGRVSMRHEVDPGDVIEDFVEVMNYSDRAVVFDLVSSDGLIGPEGAFDLLPSAAEPVDVGSWVEIAASVEVPAQESAVVPFTLTVPGDALPGDHPGGIAASVSRVGESPDGPQVGFDSRVGTRIHLRVSGELAPQVTISDLTTRYEPSWNPLQPGTLHVDYTVQNDGNVRLGSVQSATVEGLFGASAVGNAVLGEQREVLPRQEARMSAEIPGVWPLGLLDTAVYAEQSVVGEDVVDAALSSTRAGTTVWAVPWLHLALIVVLAGLVGWRLRLRKRRARAVDAAVAAAVARAREEDEHDVRATVTSGASDG